MYQMFKNIVIKKYLSIPRDHLAAQVTQIISKGVARGEFITADPASIKQNRMFWLF
jgi:hypothetical protein